MVVVCVGFWVLGVDGDERGTWKGVLAVTVSS